MNKDLLFDTFVEEMKGTRLPTIDVTDRVMGKINQMHKRNRQISNPLRRPLVISAISFCCIIFLAASITMNPDLNNWFTKEINPKPVNLFSPESSNKISYGASKFAVSYSNINDLYHASDIVAKVRVKDQENIQYKEGFFASTRSNVEVLKTYKGDSLSTLTISETGGLVDTSKTNIVKDGIGKIGNGEFWEVAIEGSPVMRTGNVYIVFLKKFPGYENYNITASVQGKLKLDVKQKIVVSPIALEVLKRNPTLFFLQNQFLGKKISEVEEAIKSIQ